MIPRSVRLALSGISWPIYVLLYTPLALVAYYSFAPAPNQTGPFPACLWGNVS